MMHSSLGLPVVTGIQSLAFSSAFCVVSQSLPTLPNIDTLLDSGEWKGSQKKISEMEAQLQETQQRVKELSQLLHDAHISLIAKQQQYIELEKKNRELQDQTKRSKQELTQCRKRNLELDAHIDQSKACLEQSKDCSQAVFQRMQQSEKLIEDCQLALLVARQSYEQLRSKYVQLGEQAAVLERDLIICRQSNQAMLSMIDEYGNKLSNMFGLLQFTFRKFSEAEKQNQIHTDTIARMKATIDKLQMDNQSLRAQFQKDPEVSRAKS